MGMGRPNCYRYVLTDVDLTPEEEVLDCRGLYFLLQRPQIYNVCAHAMKHIVAESESGGWEGL